MSCHSAHAAVSAVCLRRHQQAASRHMGAAILVHLLQTKGVNKDDRFGIKMDDLFRTKVRFHNNKCTEVLKVLTSFFYL